MSADFVAELIGWVSCIYLDTYACSKLRLKVANKFLLILILLCEAWRQRSAHAIGPQSMAFHMQAFGRDQCKKKTGSSLNKE